MRLAPVLAVFFAIVGCNAMTGIGDYVVGDGGADGNASCPTSCTDPAKTCGDACAATETACVAACSNQGCKTQCNKDGDACRKPCADTCTQCGCSKSACEKAASVSN